MQTELVNVEYFANELPKNHVASQLLAIKRGIDKAVGDIDRPLDTIIDDIQYTVAKLTYKGRQGRISRSSTR